MQAPPWSCVCLWIISWTAIIYHLSRRLRVRARTQEGTRAFLSAVSLGNKETARSHWPAPGNGPAAIGPPSCHSGAGGGWRDWAGSGLSAQWMQRERQKRHYLLS